MSAHRFLDLAERRGVLEPKVVAKIREQLRKSEKPISADALARLLVDKNRLTMLQATELLASLASEEDLFLQPLDDVKDEEIVILQPMEEPPPVSLRPPSPPPAEMALPPRAPSAMPQRSLGVNEAVRGLPAAEPNLETLQADSAEGETRLSIGRRGLWQQIWRSLWGGPTEGKVTQRWDSSLMLVGGGGLLFLVLSGLLLFLLLSRGSGDEMFQLAEDDYAAQSYGQAIPKYERFLRRFATHPKASLAEVRMGLARIRQKAEANAWPDALRIAKEEIARIRGQAAFPEGRPELAGILPQILEHFVQAARESDSVENKQSLLDQALETMALIEDPEILPASQRRGLEDRLEDVRNEVLIVEREIRRDRDLGAAVTAMRAALDSEDTPRAYQTRAELVANYPGISRNPALAEITREISQKEKLGVKPLKECPKVEPAPSIPLVSKVIPLTHHELVERLESDRTIVALAAGSTWGIRAADGAIRWRRFVGHDANFWPVRVGDVKSPDAIVQAENPTRLLRLDHASGTIQWQVNLGATAAGPVVAVNDRLYVSLTNGTLIEVDMPSGKTRGVQFPQELSSPPLVDVRNQKLYQVASQATLFALDLETLNCVSVGHLGHSPNAVVVAPVKLGDQLCVFENGGLDHCWMHVVATRETSGVLTRVGEPVRLEGNVRVPMVASDRRLFVSTDRAAVYAFELDAKGDPPAPRLIASSVASAGDPRNVFSTVSQGRWFLAGSQLLEMRLQAATGKFVRGWVHDERELHVAPPELLGPGQLAIFTRPTYSGRIRVTLVDAPAPSASPKVRWRCELGDPPIPPGLTLVGENAYLAGGASGRVWAISRQDLASGQGNANSPSTQLPLPLGRMLARSASEAIALPRPIVPKAWRLSANNGRPSSREVSFQTVSQVLTCPPGWDGEHLLCGAEDGIIFRIDPESGKRVGSSHLLSLGPQERVTWLSPVASPISRSGDRQVLYVARAEGLVQQLAGTKENPDSFAVVAESNLERPLRGNLALIGRRLLVPSRSGDSMAVLALSAETLELVEEWALEAEVRLGPTRLDTGHGVLALDDGTIFGIEPSGKLAWEKTYPHGPLAGEPLVEDDTWLCVTRTGIVFRIASGSGEQIPVSAGDTAANRPWLDLGEPIDTGVIPVGDRYAVRSRDGSIHVFTIHRASP